MNPHLQPKRRLLDTYLYDCKEGTYVNWCHLCNRYFEAIAWDSLDRFKRKLAVPEIDCLIKCPNFERKKKFAEVNRAFWERELEKEGIDPTKCTFLENGFVAKKCSK